jgi:hypothetical protein
MDISVIFGKIINDFAILNYIKECFVMNEMIKDFNFARL